MFQTALLICLILLCILLLISLIKKPFSTINNNCGFKIMSPKYFIDNNKQKAVFSIIVEKRHRYFLNFPLLFKFYSKDNFKSHVRISYKVPNEHYKILLNRPIIFNGETKEHLVHITDVIVGKIIIEISLTIDIGNPIISMELLQNSTCDLNKEYKIELNFKNK